MDQLIALPLGLEAEVARTREEWRVGDKMRRLWSRDASLWTGSGEQNWLGWLDSVSAAERGAAALAAFAESVRCEGLAHALVLGMGGSSLGPEVIATSFGRQPGWPELLVLDSTDPDQIRSVERRIDVARTLFIVASKSGTTLEPNMLMQYFLARAASALGAAQAGAHFIAITDPGSVLEQAAGQLGFRRTFLGDPTIGGRYSVLSPFGLVPAAVMGLDMTRLLGAAARMVRACEPGVPTDDNPAIALGIALGAAARTGCDKVTILTAPGLGDFAAWLEQLLAESTGKHGKGIVPIDGEPLGDGAVYGRDRLFVHMRLAGADDAATQQRLDALAHAGFPVITVVVADRYHLGQEFFRWAMATAVAGAVIGVNPFDQPDVEASKDKTRALTAAYERSGALPPEAALFAEGGVEVFADESNEAALAAGGGEDSLAGWIGAHLARLGTGDYCAILAYIERSRRHEQALQTLRTLIRDRLHVATCVGFGPRFLHSTGQVYKGGPGSGVFVQITGATEELPVPGRRYGFGVVETAQARGDFAVLAERGRRALHLHLSAGIDGGLGAIETALRRALE